MQESIQYEIRPPSRFSLNLKELWDFRELVYFFTWRDIKVKYKQTVLGAAWVVLQPLLFMVLFSLTFSRFVSAQTGNIEYPVFVFSGLLLWNVFSTGMTSAGNSMVNNAHIINKIYFPRLIIPISSILASLVDFSIQLVLFIVILLLYGKYQAIPAFLICLPLALLITLLTTFGLGTWLAALNVKYRDVRYMVPFVMQVLLFLNPIILPVSAINIPALKTIFLLNPIAAAIELLRTGLRGTAPEWPVLALAFCMSLLFVVCGVYVFRKTEHYFSDLA